MKIISDVNVVIQQVTGDLNFVAIGEIHNSRSGIKFILDNLKVLIPSDGRKTYLLTEFLPPKTYFKPNNKNKNNFTLAISHLAQNDRQKSENVKFDLKKREEDKGNSDNVYTLMELYKKLFELEVEIHSIDDPATYGDTELYRKIKADDLKAYQYRVNSFNSLSQKKAVEILQRDKTARVIIFTGMGHIAKSKVKKFTKDNGKLEEEMELIGITELLKREGLKGLSVNVHDPDLTEDSDLLKNISCTEQSYTKYAVKDRTLTIDMPDYLLFLNTPEHKNKKLHQDFESIFLPGEADFNQLKDRNYRVGLWKKLIDEMNLNNELTRITGKTIWRVNILTKKVALQDNNQGFIKSLYSHFVAYFNDKDVQNKEVKLATGGFYLLSIDNVDIDILKKIPPFKLENNEEEKIKPIP